MNNSADYINQKIAPLGIKPDIGIILGSGLGQLANEIDGIKIPYAEIPGFKTSTIQGHAGNLIVGTLNSKSIIAMQGRLHYYEGHTFQEIVYPVRVMKLLGVKTLIVTNAAGGINKSFTPGDLMIIEDHINLTGNNPLIGPNIDSLGVRFPDMSEAYSKNFIDIAEQSAKKLGINLRKGVYIAVTGPSYETPAEIRMFRSLGAEAVGMSTVPEVIAARHAGMDILGISCITNMACGILDQPLCHEEVIQVTKKVEKDFVALVKEVVKAI
ncbi:MAG: purine-nucleoside phosphorylase [Candidatus Melainabacteria bacterium GWF2_37_15]|nr:MAG: purine-nucleoside phosphorylase [Candidatus Melainabacteria bacterium GWF2_37_15]